jgi:hypothetical protein
VKHKCFMIGALALVILTSDVWAKDPVPNHPPMKANKLRTVAVTPGEGTIVYTQMISDAPGMGEFRAYNQDFGWTHAFDAPYSYVQWSGLTIVAQDVDYDQGERDIVSADGQTLGPLTGGDAGRWPTTFTVPITLLADGKVKVWVDIDSTHNMDVWQAIIESSTLRVAYVLRPDRDEAFRKMDEAWSAMSYEGRAATVKNESAFNRFAARYATLTGKQVANAIEEVKMGNPAYADIDSRLVKALISTESSNNFLALSSKGALGLGQKLTGAINAGLAFVDLQKDLDLSNFKYRNLALDYRTVPERSIGMALSYLDWLSSLPYVGNDVNRILAGYNCGPGCLRGLLKTHGSEWSKWLCKETRDYIIGIKKRAGIE